ncbi:unnamed protein product [Brugia timori]|uniref:Neur_chan_LBD domain-containing protein n=1 Tax=Brugia timori TaxID=42155 RepID=A0A0R3R0R9_9BILA|nr:unnamed protein product [Brugia timori]
MAVLFELSQNDCQHSQTEALRKGISMSTCQQSALTFDLNKQIDFRCEFRNVIIDIPYTATSIKRVTVPMLISWFPYSSYAELRNWSANVHGYNVGQIVCSNWVCLWMPRINVCHREAISSVKECSFSYDRLQRRHSKFTNIMFIHPLQEHNVSLHNFTNTDLGQSAQFYGPILGAAPTMLSLILGLQFSSAM